MNTKEDNEKKWREEFEKWSEDEKNPNPYQTDMDYAEYGEACYITACKKRQEEIDIENSIIKEYREQCILNAEENQRLRANHEEFARKMGDEIHVRNNHVRELKEEIRRLKDLATRAKPWVEREMKKTRFRPIRESREQWLKDASEVIGE